MKLKALSICIALLHSISSPVLADVNWRNFGTSNGGSEILLDTNSLSVSEDKSIIFFNYRTAKDGKTIDHTGGSTLCGNSNPAAWVALNPGSKATPVVVVADSPASRAMLQVVCQNFNYWLEGDRSQECSSAFVAGLRSDIEGVPDDSFGQALRRSIDRLESLERDRCR